MGTRGLCKPELGVRSPYPPPYSPGDGIGIRVGLRSQILRVRVSPGAPKTVGGRVRFIAAVLKTAD